MTFFKVVTDEPAQPDGVISTFTLSAVSHGTVKPLFMDQHGAEHVAAKLNVVYGGNQWRAVEVKS